MVREVIPDCNTRSRAPQLHAAPDALEARERLDGSLRIDAGSLCRGDGRERILKVVPALKLPAQQPNSSALIEYFKGAPPDHACTPTLIHAKPLHRAPAAASKDTVDRGVGAVHYQFSGSRYRSDKVVKLGLNRCKIREDVSMIELYVVQNRQPWPVMHHLGTFVEESGIVFIGFDHEIDLFPQPGRYAKVDRNAANEEPRV